MEHTLADLLEDIKSIEPLPQVATRVIQLASHTDVVPRDLVDVIQTDAGTTAKVLKLCNSALYGFKREIASLPEAGNLLGVSTLANLVMTSCTGRYFRDYGHSDPAATMKLWEQSISNAFATSSLAGRQGGVDRNRAYTIGLLENLGHLVLMRFVPDSRDAVAHALAGGEDLLAIEARLYGLDHAEVGARLAERWNFPPVLSDAIRFHHAPDSAVIDPLMASFGHLGEVVTHRLGFGAMEHDAHYALRESALNLTGMTRAGLDALEPALKLELAKAKRVLEIA